MTKTPKGVCILLIKLDKQQVITIGKQGEITFPSGYYAYIGSALNGLEPRLARHLRKEKALHWHIDYFLRKASIDEIIYSKTEKERECIIASQLSQELNSIPHFGCSDCQCISHLYYCEDKSNLRMTIRNSFKKSGIGKGIFLENHSNNIVLNSEQCHLY